MGKSISYHSSNRRNQILSVILSLVLIAVIVTGLIIRFFFLDNPHEGMDGVLGFRLFTVLSNTVVLFAVSMTIPYTIDGLRGNNYHLPRWVITVLYVGVVCVTITCITTLLILLPTTGIKASFFESSNHFLHFLSPVLSIVLFVLIDHSHFVAFRSIWIALIPAYVYMLFYMIMVFIVKQENGGWPDFYNVNKILPWYVMLIPFIGGSFLVALCLRHGHNKTHKKQKAAYESYYLTSSEYACDTIDSSIQKLAQSYTKTDGDVIVPRRALLLINKRYGEPYTINDCMKRYLDALDQQKTVSQ